MVSYFVTPINTSFNFAEWGFGSESSKSLGTISFNGFGDLVKKDTDIAIIDNVEIKTPLTGVLRGIIRNNSTVIKGLKIADVDPRAAEKKNCFTI